MDEQTSVANTRFDLTLSQELRDDIAARLLAWYRIHKRDLPWRGASPYAIWVSEIMLQQTQVATVIPYFQRFLERFPTVEALAAAPIEEVLKLWAGLGYYARARNLHHAAQQVVAQFGGRVPDTPAEIASLPGIGRYTAGAILSMAYDQPRPLVDANVIRVLSRLFGLHGDPKSAANQTALWSLAEQLVPAESPGDFNQALMELGALVCEPVEPKCERCPALAVCVAGNSPDPSALPEIPPGRATVAVTHSAALIRDEAGRVLIAQRPMHGLWGGLWEFPRVVCASGESPQEGAARAAREVVGVEVEIGMRIGKVKHGVTHHRITLHGFAARLRQPDAVPTPRDCAAVCWATLDTLDDYAFSSPQALLRSALLAHAAKEASGDLQPAFEFDDVYGNENARG
jgi:A/G-specific adenine glycosylase